MQPTVDLLTSVGLALTILALLLSIWQLWAARSQTTQLKQIGDSLSTRYLGEFPHYLREIAPLLGEAQSRVLVACTIPAHAVFTAPDGWQAVRTALDALIGEKRKVELRCAFSTHAAQREFLSAQFDFARQTWSQWSQDEGNVRRLNLFFSRYGSAEARSYEDFLACFDRANDAVVDALSRVADVNSYPRRIPMYMWIVDEKKAIFAVATSHPYFSAKAFYTTDASLITSLIDLHAELMSPTVAGAAQSEA